MSCHPGGDDCILGVKFKLEELRKRRKLRAEIGSYSTLRFGWSLVMEMVYHLAWSISFESNMESEKVHVLFEQESFFSRGPFYRFQCSFQHVFFGKWLQTQQDILFGVTASLPSEI